MALAAVAAVVVVWACGSGDRGPAGGPVSGALDTHCGTNAQAVNSADCNLTEADGGTVPPDYGAAMYNSEADDDDCKYHVKFTVDPVYENNDTYFTVNATLKTNGQPASGANIDPEVFLSDTHPAPNTSPKSVESPPGTYKVGPVRFDAKGRWTVRFHLYETCTEVAADSPHGHAAFFIDVP